MGSGEATGWEGNRAPTYSFAPFIAAGALLTAVFAGNLVSPLIDLGLWLRGGITENERR